MRGDTIASGELVSYVDVEARLRSDPRAIGVVVNKSLAALERDFAAVYS